MQSVANTCKYFPAFDPCTRNLREYTSKMFGYTRTQSFLTCNFVAFRVLLLLLHNNSSNSAVRCAIYHSALTARRRKSCLCVAVLYFYCFCCSFFNFSAKNRLTCVHTNPADLSSLRCGFKFHCKL